MRAWAAAAEELVAAVPAHMERRQQPGGHSHSGQRGLEADIFNRKLASRPLYIYLYISKMSAQLHTSAEDSLRRHLRPLHLDKKWSTAIKTLSRRGSRLRVFVCGPKASGKSTFARYLLNHLLSVEGQAAAAAAAAADSANGVAFLDLDPGQPEFAPMGQVYLARLRRPIFGPPFTHPSLDEPCSDGEVVRAHHIGATSPKEDPGHFIQAATDLMERYEQEHQRSPLIVNYPGWIFGLGLEVATQLIRSLALTDVVYMSDKGPPEVIEPLAETARQTAVELTTLPSQPVDYATRSSAQLRAMQIQSYFHLRRGSSGLPWWCDAPVSRLQPIRVDYSGPRQGLLGISVVGGVSLRHVEDLLEGSIVAVVYSDSAASDAVSVSANDAVSVIRTKANVPYLQLDAALDPRTWSSLGLALVRRVDTRAQQLELVTPIAHARIRRALERGGSGGLVLVRGLLDSPSWAVGEDYHAAARSGQQLLLQPPLQQAGRVRRASRVPWMTLVEDSGRRLKTMALVKLRKRATSH